MLDCQPQG